MQQTSPKFQVCTTKTLFHWLSNNVLQMSSLVLQTQGSVGKVLDDPPAFFPWDRSYFCCDCCLQVRDSLGLLPHTLPLRYPHI